MRIIISLIALCTSITYSQVGINNPNPKVSLHTNSLKLNDISDGVIAPILKLSELNKKENLYNLNHKGTLIYINAIDAPQTKSTRVIITPGYYYFNGKAWKTFIKQEELFFYASYFVTKLDEKKQGVEIDLYEDVYKKQFIKGSNPQFISSNPETIRVKKEYLREELDYVIIHYDIKTIKVNTITPQGILNLDVLSLDFGLNSFMNLVFVVKQSN
ncbi:hypothetical protein K5I29_13130 [Flavobacterium agricola]|uniref:Uncharacterized protein n=1 Tax=Flavobacterium agricola TaxID=2870839 RepID=A0ABY6LYF0_9FLAO|nr:hypothetical protein [Flavobacterium agricola]UYW01357.1 hypothetical protein K5I29_13130 [Flavobacterium agricola]